MARSGRVLAGSTVRRVIHGAPCAVAVAPHQWRPLPSDAPISIGVAFTDSPEAREALAAARRPRRAPRMPRCTC